MPNVTLHFMAANDLNGDPLLEVTDNDDFLKGVELRPRLHELGGGKVRLARDVGFALFQSDAVEPEVFVRVLVHAYSGTNYFTGFFLDKREQKVVGEEGTEEYIFGGPGPKQYLDRAILTDEQFTGPGWNVDVDNGVFTFNSETQTAGRILNRILSEAQANPVNSIPDLTWNFTDTDDTDSNPWMNTVSVEDDDFTLPIGQSLLKDLWELEDAAELETRVELGSVSNRVFRLEALPVIGTDYSGDEFATDTLRLVEASGAEPFGNIASPGGGSSLWVRGQSLRKATHVLIRGKDGVYATAVKSGWTDGDYTKWAAIDYQRSSNVTMLENAGIRWIRRQEEAGQEFEIPILPGVTPEEGRYFPDPDGLLWVGNTAALWTGGVTGTPLDWRNDPFRVTGINMELLEASDAETAEKRALSWEVKVLFNTGRGGASSPSQGTTGASSGGGSCSCTRPNPQLCRPSTPAGDVTYEYWTWEDTPTGTTWTDEYLTEPVEHPLTAGAGTVGPYAAVSNGVQDIAYGGWTGALGSDHFHSVNQDAGQSVAWLPGMSGTWSFYVRPFNNPIYWSLYFIDDTGATISGGANVDVAGGTLTADTWNLIEVAIPEAPAGTEGIRLAGRTAAAEGGVQATYWVDEVTISSAEIEAQTGDGHPDLVGTSKRVTRCDHRHDVHRDTAPTVDDDEDDGYKVGTLWAQLDDLDAPTEIVAVWVLADATAGAAIWLPWPASSHTHDDYLTEAEVETLIASQRWEAVTDGEDVFVWEDDDLVHEWKAY